MARKTGASAVTDNAHDIGYVLGKVEMIEKKMDEQSVELELVLTKLDDLSKSMSFWRHTLWVFKALVMSIPLIAAGNMEGLSEYWKNF